ncbi:fumarylacetoacetate hydrolase [Halobacteriales archaeon QS_4_69_31]|nr:MAG: fumarylacetoacetate hydrolase [Halobacteriales archaeon QS_4_69_31]
MRYFRVRDGGESRLVASDGDVAYDLTADGGPSSLVELYRIRSETGRTVDDVARERLDEDETVDLSAATVELPVEPGEVWAAGVTYRISEEARREESGKPDVYIDVYESDRPEVFFKASPSRTVGPDEAVGIRGDSEWDVPEPELGVVLHEGEIVGYTVGNDVSSRSIEGANPLYLPQAKVYDRCCALGPCVASVDDVPDPHDLEMTMTIRRDDDVVFRDSTSTAEMVRTCEELTSYLTRHNVVPETTVLLTGTALVPSSEFTLRPGDAIEVTVEDIGTLHNGVITV